MAFRARNEALKLKSSLIGELEVERKVASEAKAQIGRLTQAETASRGEFERKVQALEAQIEHERSTAAEARRAVEAVREGALEELEQSVNEERLARVMLEAEVERPSKRATAMPAGTHADSALVDRLRGERDDARQRQGELEAELDRLRALLKKREEAEGAKTASKTFTTDAPRPASLYDRRPDVVDDLKEVKGIGPVMEHVLNEKGCYHFKQLANFSKRDIEWISAALGSFPDRIERDNWVGQAQMLYARKYGQHHDVGNAGVIKTLETVS